MPEHLGYELAAALGCESGEFREEIDKILSYLQKRLGFGLWMFTRVQGGDWIVLNAQDNGYGVTKGDVFNWEDSFCSQMVEGKGPQIAPDSDDVPCYKEAEIGKKVPIRSYVGVPIKRSDGELFGTLCAIDPKPKDVSIMNELALVNMFGGVIAQMIEKESNTHAVQRTEEELALAVETDVVTGLKNRLAWGKTIDAEDVRSETLGCLTMVIIATIDIVNSSTGEDGFRTNDELFIEFAEILRNSLKGQGSAYRIDSNEFAVLLPDILPSITRKILLEFRASLYNANIKASLGMSLRDPKKGLRFAWSQAEDEAMGRSVEARQAMAS